MGRKKKSSKKKQKKNVFNIDVAVVFMIVLSILLFVLIYSNAGVLGEVLSPMLGGMIGFIKYIIPVGTFAIAICMVKDDKDYLFSKLMQYLVFLACVAGMMTIYQISKGNINTSLEFEKVIQVAYDLGIKNIGGGTIGAVISVPLIKLLGMFGATILLLGIAVMLLIFTFGIRPSEIIIAILERMNERKDEIAEGRAEAMDEIKERRLKLKQDKQARINNKNSQARKNVMREEITGGLDNPSHEIGEEEIQINIPNHEVMDDGKNNKAKKESKFKLFKHDDDLIPEKKVEKPNPNEIEANLFKKVEEVKEEKTKYELQLDTNITEVDDENYEFPPIELMKQGEVKNLKGGKKALTDTAARLQKTLYSFGVSAKVENVSVGPAITRYELKPAEGVRVSKIAKLSDDIALNLAAESIRIEAPIPGKQAVGIEIPNSEKEIVHLRDIIESDKFQDAESKLAFALGKDVGGEAIVTDIAKMPHVLIAGSTGSGKSVCINTLITSILYKAKPSEVKLVMVDPKVVELSVYNGIPHLLIPVVTDPKKAAGALAWAVQEMVNRYGKFAEKGVRDIKGYNELMKEDGEEGKLPQIVIIIDELADLMMVAPNDVEDAICRLAQMARAAGMHLVIATQRPSVDVITGIIKANVPSRIAFAVSSQIDSRTILDMAGAEKLLGKGDMLFYPVGVSKPVRIQGAFVSDKEVEKIVDFLKASTDGKTIYNEDILEKIEKANTSDRELENSEDDEADPFLEEAIETVIDIGQASTSFIQRRFKVGYARAGRIIDQMEERGIISGYEGSKPRQVLMSKERWAELKMAKPAQATQEANTEE